MHTRFFKTYIKTHLYRVGPKQFNTHPINHPPTYRRSAVTASSINRDFSSAGGWDEGSHSGTHILSCLPGTPGSPGEASLHQITVPRVPRFLKRPTHSTPRTVAASPFKFQFLLTAVPAEPRPEAPRRTARTPAPSRRRRASRPRGAGWRSAGCRSAGYGVPVRARGSANRVLARPPRPR